MSECGKGRPVGGLFLLEDRSPPLRNTGQSPNRGAGSESARPVGVGEIRPGNFPVDSFSIERAKAPDAGAAR